MFSLSYLSFWPKCTLCVSDGDAIIYDSCGCLKGLILINSFDKWDKCRTTQSRYFTQIASTTSRFFYVFQPDCITVLYGRTPTHVSGDCVAAWNYKHPGWRPLLGGFSGVVWKGFRWGGLLSDCDGWPWQQLPVVFISSAPLSPAFPLSSTPQSPDDNSSALAVQAGWDFYRHTRHLGDCQDNELKAQHTHISAGARSGWPGSLSALSQSPPWMTQ